MAVRIVEQARDDLPLVDVLGHVVVDRVVEMLLEDADAVVAPGVDGAASQHRAVLEQREVVIRVGLAARSGKEALDALLEAYWKGIS